MKAAHFDRVGSLDSLQLAEVPDPVAAAGEVVVKVHAAGVSPSDVKNVLGKFEHTTVPRIPGRDFAGVVVDGSPALVGQAVWGSGGDIGFTRDGSHAEFLAVPVAGIAPKPNNLSDAEAATCGVPYATAWQAIQRTGVYAESAFVVIGTGAVATAAHAIGVARGATVIVGVRRVEQVAELAARGVMAYPITEAEEFARFVRRHFGGGAHVVFDTTGFHLPTAIRVLAARGVVAVIAAPTDGHERVPMLEFYRREATLVGINTIRCDTRRSAEILRTLYPLFESGSLVAPTGIVPRPLDTAVETYRDIAAGTRGKFVLTMDRSG